MFSDMDVFPPDVGTSRIVTSGRRPFGRQNVDVIGMLRACVSSGRYIAICFSVGVSIVAVM